MIGGVHYKSDIEAGALRHGDRGLIFQIPAFRKTSPR
jgi:hypothetical protein